MREENIFDRMNNKLEEVRPKAATFFAHLSFLLSGVITSYLVYDKHKSLFFGVLSFFGFVVLYFLILRVSIAWARSWNKEFQELDFDENLTYGFVYFLRWKKYIKIGHTNSIDERMDRIIPEMPFKPKLLFYVKTNNQRFLEKKYHYIFRRQRKNGEWFVLSIFDLSYIKSTLEKK